MTSRLNRHRFHTPIAPRLWRPIGDAKAPGGGADRTARCSYHTAKAEPYEDSLRHVRKEDRPKEDLMTTDRCSRTVGRAMEEAAEATL